MSTKFSQLFLTLAILATISFAPAYAQSTDPSLDIPAAQSGLSLPEAFPQIQEQLDVTVTPENPKSGEQVTITAEAYDIDLNTLLMTWTLNGQQALKGIGQKKFVFNVGQAGSVTKVNLTIVTKSGSKVVRDFVFSPVDVDVLWEANTYTPPFYKGKALFTPEANVMFVAMPNIVQGGRAEAPSDVVYNWLLDYDAQGDKSGFGKNTFDYTGPIFIRPTTVSVNVYSSSNPALRGTGDVTINPESPVVDIYENSPVLGVLLNRALSGQFALRGNEVKVEAYPYFFTAPNKNSTVTYNWLLNSQPLVLPGIQNSLILKRPQTGSGMSSINLDITNDSKILQTAAASFGILFDSH